MRFLTVRSPQLLLPGFDAAAARRQAAESGEVILYEGPFEHGVFHGG